MSRPELTGHASIYYNDKEARKYDSSSRMMGIQREITERALELLRLPDARQNPSISPSLVLDIGCGSGLSGKVLEERGHVWVGCDISRDMLNVAKERMDTKRCPRRQLKQHRKEDSDQMEQDNDDDHDDDNDDDEEEEDQVEHVDTGTATGDLLHHDMGTGLPYRPATFDACISISALQWLCYSNSAQQNPRQRLLRFFSSLYSVLKRGGRAVLQFYPETAEQAVLISETATRVGFAGGVVIDYPNSAKAKKHYLVLSFDRHSKQQHQEQAVAAAEAREHVTTQSQTAVTVSYGTSNKNKAGGVPPRKKKGGVKTKEWIMHKKQTQREKGKTVRPDTKYTARRRPHKF